MLKILLAEAEMELIPEQIWNHAAVRKIAKATSRRAAETILDQNAHAQAIKQLADGERRGRPDIVHYTLLTILDSALAKAGQVEVAIHTRNNELIRIKPDTRLPRGEQRFHGLMAKVLLTGKSQDKDPLIWIEAKCQPAEALQRIGATNVVRMDEGGNSWEPAEADATIVIGAYPKGDFSEAWKTAVPDAASIVATPLSAWAVAAEVVTRVRLTGSS